MKSRTLPDYFFEEPEASKLTGLRIKARLQLNRFKKLKILTYDCIHAIVKGNSVVCKKKHRFKSVGGRKKEGFGILAALRGWSSGVCQNCADYNGETNE